MLYLVLENLRAFLINQDGANGSRFTRGLLPHLIYLVFSGPSNRDAVFQSHASFVE